MNNYDENEAEIRDIFYGNMSDDEYEEMKHRSRISSLESALLNLNQDLRVLDNIFDKHNVDAYYGVMPGHSLDQIITKEQEEKILFEFTESNLSFKNLQNACDQKIYLEMLIEDLKDELEILKEGAYEN